MRENRLIFYDTCNYRDYPVGGQVTSIKNFLSFLSREYPEHGVMIESGGITWLFNDEFYPFRGAVKAIREAAGLVGMEKLMWGALIASDKFIVPMQCEHYSLEGLAQLLS